MTSTTTSALENKAMIVTLDASFWSAGKTDRDLTDAVTGQYGADSKAATVRKRLINGKALKPISSAIQSVKIAHKHMTLPWDDNGTRILPVEMFAKYRETLDTLIGHVEQATQDFITEYDQHVEASRSALGEMFDISDYPHRAELEQKFGVAYHVAPVPTGRNFVADIGEAEAERMREQIERRTQAKLALAIDSLGDRLEEALVNFVNALGQTEDGKPRRIHQSTLDGLQAVCDAIPALNLTHDSRLNRIANDIREAIEGVELDELRVRSSKPAVIAEKLANREALSDKLASIAGAYFGSE